MKFVSRSIVDQNQEKEIPKEGDQEVGDSSNTTAQDEYDPRTLYERLQEQKNIKEELFQEQTRLSNLIKRVDDEEAEYYQTLSDVQERLNLEKAQKERDELEAFRKAVEETRHTQPTVDTVGTITKTDTTMTATTKSSSSSSATQKPGRRRSSKNALEGLVVVKKKRTGDEKDEAEKDDKKEDEHQSKKVKPNATIAAATDSKKKADTSSPSGSKTGLSTLMAAYSSDSESDDE